MSADRGDKKLLPEILPAPQPLAGAAPRERVNDRARLLLERFRALGTTAGAAVLSLHCTYGTVDPLPPPPTQCSALADPFASFQVRGYYASYSPDEAPSINIQIMHPNADGYTLSAVRVTANGTLLSIDTSSTTAADTFLIQIAPITSPGPSDAGTGWMLFEVDVACGGDATTLHYRALLTPQQPGSPVTVEKL